MKPTDDELEARTLHAAELDMDRALAQEEKARGGDPDATRHYELDSPVHAGRLGAALYTLRLLGGSVRRLLGRAADLEATAGRQAARLVIVEGAVVLLFGALALVLAGVQVGLAVGILAALYLWWWGP